MTLNFVKIKENAALPEKGTSGAAAFDLRACIDEPMTIKPGEIAKVPTGLAVETPVGYASLLFARSGLALKKGIALANGVGVVDSDYRGEIGVALINNSSEEFTVNPSDRIAQIGLVPFVDFVPVFVDKLSDTSRAEGGFGHTGVG